MPSPTRQRRVSCHGRSPCVVFPYLVAFVPWPGSSNIVASVSCVALVHFTIRATLEAILEHGAPGPHGDRPTVSRDPLPPCVRVPPVPWGSGCRSRSGPRPAGLGCRCHAGRGDGTTLGTCWGRPAGGEKAFWSNLGYFCHVQSVVSVLGTRAGTSLSWRAPQSKPSCATEMLPGLKKEVNPRVLASCLGSFSFFLPIWEGGASSFGSRRLGRSWSRSAGPVPAPQRSAPAEAAFNAPSLRVDSVVPSLIV